MGTADAKMENVLLGLGDAEAGRVEALIQRGEFFWLDLDLDSPEAGRLGGLLNLPEQPLNVLLDFDSSTSIFRRRYVDEEQVVFPFCCIRDLETPPLDPDGMRPVEVQVLVRGDCVVTVHHGPCRPLDELAGDRSRVTRSEQHLIYRVLDRMVSSVFESVADLGAQQSRVESEFGQPRTGRRDIAFIRDARARLFRLRGMVEPQLTIFERISDELPDVKGLAGDEHRYFASIQAQLGHAVGSIDAANDRLSGLLDLRLNRMTVLLTVVATLFLPITFLSGFFGQNFDLLVSDLITSAAAFWLLGIGLLVLSTLSSLWLIYRQLGPRNLPPRSR